MNFSVIVCTYQRPKQISRILTSIEFQTLAPDEIWIIDGSFDDNTETLVKEQLQCNSKLFYVKVDAENRGLTKQRNVGLEKISEESEIVVFLDDDLILQSEFFEELLKAFKMKDVIGSDGFIINENHWKKSTEILNNSISKIYFDGYYLTLSLRDLIRRYLGLYPSEIQPGLIPMFGHGKSSLPPTGKIYEVDHIMGGITAYRKEVFSKIKFSTFFEGYGLYEDFDFSVRASQFGKIVTNTAAHCEHHHASQGRPNKFKYGKMVVWNGYYVWRLKYPKLKLKYVIKWHIITLFLIIALVGGVIWSKNRRDYVLEMLGRMSSYIKLFFIKPPLTN